MFTIRAIVRLSPRWSPIRLPWNSCGSLRRPQGYLLLLALAAGLLAAPEASANVLDNFGQALLDILNSTFLRALSIVAVIAMGLMALGGRIQWMAFISTLLAVVIVFGAAGIVDYIRDHAGIGSTAAAGDGARIARCV